MQIKDEQGLVLSGASATAADAYRQALGAYHRYAGDPMTLLAAARADSPGFVMAHALTAYMTLIGTGAEEQALGVAAFTAAQGLPCTERERGHLAALGHIMAGEIRAAGRVLEDVAIAWPRDTLALHVGQLMDFLVGDSRMMRDRIGRALPAWSEGMPGHHAVLGLLAFGLEETGLYDRAEAAGRRALELEPRNGWARHAVAHVMEMQDRRADGVAFMRADIPAWTQESFFQIHNWWHLALFHLGMGEVDEVLRLYDGPIFGPGSDHAFDMIDAAALLWRLELRGIEVGGRWEAIADAYAAKGMRGGYAFDDAHALMAFMGAGRMDAARELISAQAGVGGDNAGFVAEAGLAVMQGLYAFGQGDYGRAAETLRGVRNRTQRFGGSDAQRDLVDLTLIAAASRSQNWPLERALLAERAAARPLASPEARARLAA